MPRSVAIPSTLPTIKTAEVSAPEASPTGAVPAPQVLSAPATTRTPLSEPMRANVAREGSTPLRANLEARLELDGTWFKGRTEIFALLTQYFPNKAKPVSRPAERVLMPVLFLDTELRKAKTKDEAIEIAGSSDFRRRVFTLEGALKLYRGSISKDLDAQYDNFKKLEDVSGAYAYAKTMTKTAKDNQAPAQVIALFEKKEVEAKKALGDLLERDGFVLDDKGRFPALKSLMRDIRHGEFGSYDSDRKGLLRAIKRDMKKVEDSSYDMGDLEGGLHELRRQLRWVTIYTEAVDGLVQHDENKEPKLAAVLADPVAASKYMTMPAADRELAPVVVSKSLYAQHQKVVLDLGALKDRGEAIHAMRDAYLATGLAKTETEATDAAVKLLKLKPEETDLVGLSRPIYDAIRSGGWFKQLRKQMTES